MLANNMLKRSSLSYKINTYYSIQWVMIQLKICDLYQFIGKEIEYKDLKLLMTRGTNTKAGRTKYQQNQPILRWTEEI